MNSPYPQFELVSYTVLYVPNPGTNGVMPTFEMNIINKEKKAARHELIHSFVLSLKVTPEFPVASQLFLVLLMLKKTNLLISGSTKVV